MRGHIITRRHVFLAMWMWILLVLLAAAVNVPWALSYKRSRTTIARVPTTFVTGPAAAEKPWPSQTPHAVPWPTPTYRNEGRLFAVRTYDVRAEPRVEGRNGFAMSVQHLGWPLPVLEEKQMWWDWNDPALQGPESDPAMTTLPLGLVVNPLVLGTATWLVLVLPVVALVAARRAWRQRGDCCIECGYPVGIGPVCTECGHAVEASRRATVPTA